MMQYQAEPFSKWCREAIERGLFEAHWREVGVNQDIKKLDPDLNKCFGLERAQALPAYTARSDGALMGYAVFFCSTGLHYREWVTAYADVLYMVPEARGNASQLIRYCERELLARGNHLVVGLEFEGHVVELARLERLLLVDRSVVAGIGPAARDDV